MQAHAVCKSPTGRRVVVIDDNQDSNQTLAMLLDIAGHEVLSAYDGTTGLQAIKSFNPGVVLLDIGLPGMDGYEVARRLRADASLQDIYIIALTGYGKDSDIEQAQMAGFDAHLLKPARTEDLLELISALPRNRLN